jgi:hypothetical protein
MTRYLGVLVVLFALAVSIIPAFTDCESQGKALVLESGKEIPMKCHWTAQASIAVGVPLAAVGAMMVATRKRQSLLILGGMSVVLGIFAIALPSNNLIGVCATPTMICHTVMRPALTVLGALTISAGAVVSWLAWRTQD